MRGLVDGLYLLLAVVMTTAQVPSLISETEPKILCLYSKELRNGMDFNAFCTLTKPASTDVSVFISLRKTADSTSSLVFTNSMFTITIGSGDVHGSDSLLIPFDLETGANYSIHTSFTGLAIKPVYEQAVVYRPELPYFITTDKPVYRPGEDVLIRALTCDMYLKPTATSATIEIKDSNDNKIEKITSVTNSNSGFPSYINALIDTNFTLSDEPVPGMYTVSLYTDEGYVERKFEVKEFVLPRFEVKIELEQPFLIFGDDEIRGKIMAIYSYGEDVLGSARIKLKGSYGLYNDQEYAWDLNNFDGSAEFTVPIDEEKYPMPFYNSYVSMDTKMYLHGEVIEANTGDVQSIEVSVTIYRTDYTAKLGPMPLLFRGNPDYTFPVTLTNPIGGKISDYAGYTLHYKTYDDKDFSKMVVSSNPMNVNVKLNTSDTSLTGNQVEVYFSREGDKMNSPRITQQITKYYTWSKEMLKVELVNTNNKDQRCFKITPFKSGEIAYYQVVNNYYAEQIVKYEDTNGYCFQIQQKHAPKTRLLVYKVVPYTDGTTSSEELVSAYLDVDITWSPQQKVELEVTSKTGADTVRPGEEVEVLVKTNGEAIVGLTGRDKRLSFMAEQNDITMSEIEDAVARQRSFERKKDNPIPNPPIFPMPFMRGPIAKRKKRCAACITSDQYMDARKLLEGSGQIVVTNIDLKRQKDFEINDDIDYEFFEYAALDEAVFQKAENPPELGAVPDEAEEELYDDGKETGGEEVKERSNFPDTWLWELLLTNGNGEYKKDVMVPDSITNWEVIAFGFNKQYGLSVSEKKEITVFQEFFISMYMPYSVVQSERVKLDILVFNYQSKELTVTVELVDTENFTIKDKTIFSNPIRIKPGTSGVQRVFVTFDKIGDIPLKAIAKDVNSNNQDIVIRTLIVKPKGRKIRDDTNLVIDMTKNTSPELSFNISKFFKEPGYVPNSLRMYIFVTGDMMGPFIILIVSKIEMPFGCGEQNIKSLTPAVFVARYLTQLGRLDDKTKSLVKKVCGVGVKKEYNYLHKDGSFSAFGESDNLCVCGAPGKKFGSTWLTAYVLMSFSLLYSDDITYIDPANLKKSFDYIKNNATVKDCIYQYFVEKGELIHLEMKGISSTRFGFTAFITIAVMDYKKAALKAGLTQSAQDADELAKGAISWLKAQKSDLLRQKEPYQLAMVAYALSRYNKKMPDPDSIALLETLEKVLAGEEKSVKDDEACVYSPTSGDAKSCSSDTDCTSGYECCMVPCSKGMKKCSRKPYRPVFRGGMMPEEQNSPSKSIEMNGYRMMAYLNLYDLEVDSTKKAMYLKKAETIKEWLLSKRKGNGLFESTQDTVVALRALARYAMAFPNKNGADFTVTAKVDGKAVTETVAVSDDTYTTIQEEKLDVNSIPSAVNVAVTGSKGVAYLNLVALYNVDKNVTTKPYVINVEPRTKNNKPLMRVCFKRNPNFTGDIGAMVTVQMEMESGITVQGVTAEDQRDSNLSPKKYDFDQEEGRLDVYYMVNENPLNDDRCTHVFYDVEFAVENKQAKEVRVSNYYSPEVSASILYNIDPAGSREIETTTVTIGASNAQLNMLLLLSAILAVMFCRMFM